MKRNLFFNNKKCEICKKQATKFRCTANKTFVLCDSAECDKISKIKAGIFITNLEQLRKFKI